MKSRDGCQQYKIPHYTPATQEFLPFFCEPAAVCRWQRWEMEGWGIPILFWGSNCDPKEKPPQNRQTQARRHLARRFQPRQGNRNSRVQDLGETSSVQRVQTTRSSPEATGSEADAVATQPRWGPPPPAPPRQKRLEDHVTSTFSSQNRLQDGLAQPPSSGAGTLRAVFSKCSGTN